MKERLGGAFGMVEAGSERTAKDWIAWRLLCLDEQREACYGMAWWLRLFIATGVCPIEVSV